MGRWLTYADRTSTSVPEDPWFTPVIRPLLHVPPTGNGTQVLWDFDPTPFLQWTCRIDTIELVSINTTGPRFIT
jgi:hypothetical protein